jgi:hypothetical protein
VPYVYQCLRDSCCLMFIGDASDGSSDTVLFLISCDLFTLYGGESLLRSFITSKNKWVLLFI